jgi:hypothetical protein
LNRHRQPFQGWIQSALSPSPMFEYLISLPAAEGSALVVVPLIEAIWLGFGELACSDVGHVALSLDGRSLKLHQ